jgi:hypothetical protein
VTRTTAEQVGTIAGALSSLAATDNALVPLCARTIPGLVHMLEHGDVECREEAAHALKFFAVVSCRLTKLGAQMSFQLRSAC